MLALVALWLQDVIVPYSMPFWGLFDNQLDLDVYRAGAQTVLDGQKLYDVKLLGQMDYTYAPISIPFFIPFALMSFSAARIVWSAGIIVALYLVIMLSFRVLGRRPSWQVRVIAGSLVAVVMLLEPVRTTIWYGQINVFLMLLVLADLTRTPDRTGAGESRWRGAATGLAAGIKMTPLIFGLYLAIVGRWRAVAGLVAGFAATIVIGFVIMPKAALKFWTARISDSNRVGSPQSVGNQSLRGWLANLTGTDTPSTTIWLVLAVVALGVGMYAAYLAHHRGNELLALTMVGMTGCAVSPMSWGHHWVWFVPLTVIGVDLLLRADVSSMRRLLVGAGLVAMLLAAFSWRTHYDHAIWFVLRSVPDGYMIGLFFKTGVGWLKWFTIFPYGAIFAVSALATIAVYRPVRVAETAIERI
ncbi:putative glycosyltransferase [Gordonia amarae NBRC 15530]|uniref:Putative glycosyltransferase n=1 Tax=Gordonia amarae NBRC 15530 TaxID=1075090 RepID=G7GMA0_9ACTN|nr:putative glycosyltransferase [Gordonia amarae NBRC 15530]